ncbi:MAG: hypothetical protein Q8Q90_02580 [bacterium]|nr:hypothetical protein [bacterium]
MTNSKFQIPKKIHAPCFKFHASNGYAAMFSFLVMMVVLGTLFSVFSILVLKGVFLARTSVIEFKNIYAIESFIEDALRRNRDTDLADISNGESLEVADSVVSASLLVENSVRDYLFSSQVGNKYFGNGTLRIDGVGSSSKIKRWQDTQ